MEITGGTGDGTDGDGIDGTVGDGDGMPGAGTHMVLVDSMIFTRILSILGFTVAFMEVFMILSALLSTDIIHHIEGQDILTMDTLDMVEEGMLWLVTPEGLIPLEETSRQIPEEGLLLEEVLRPLEEVMV